MATFLGGLLGLSGGVSAGSSSSTSNTTQNQSGSTGVKNSYSAGQTSLQDLITQTLAGLMPGIASGSMSPNVSAMETASADQINKNYAGVGDRMNRFLAARGFGKSGVAGKTALQTELGRQGALANNESNFANTQLNQNNQTLGEALAAAFNSTGSTTDWTSLANTVGKSSGSGWGIGLGASLAPRA